jgi:hypothetical protein
MGKRKAAEQASAVLAATGSANAKGAKRDAKAACNAAKAAAAVTVDQQQPEAFALAAPKCPLGEDTLEAVRAMWRTFLCALAHLAVRPSAALLQLMPLLHSLLLSPYFQNCRQ